MIELNLKLPELDFSCQYLHDNILMTIIFAGVLWIPPLLEGERCQPRLNVWNWWALLLGGVCRCSRKQEERDSRLKERDSKTEERDIQDWKLNRTIKYIYIKRKENCDKRHLNLNVKVQIWSVLLKFLKYCFLYNCEQKVQNIFAILANFSSIWFCAIYQR